MQWFVLEEQVSLLGPGEMGGCGWVGYIHVGLGRSAEVMEVDDNSVGSEGGAIQAERQNSDCTEEMVEACWPVGDKHTAGVTAGEMAEGKEWEMVCIAGTAGSVERTPGDQRLGPAEQQTRTLVNGARMPLYQWLEV